MQPGTLAKKIGLSVDAIHLYKSKSVLPRPPRSLGGFRQCRGRHDSQSKKMTGESDE
jgi:DNA-binding transcriptional MerR regulator